MIYNVFRKNRFFIVSVLTLALWGCTVKEPVKKEESAIPVKATKVELRDLNDVLEYVGNIKAQDEVNVYPKVSGKIIEKVKEDGSRVSKGDTILYIDRDEVGLTFEKAPVESPLSGVVGRVYVDIGANVSSQTPVALVVNMDKAKINLDIPERYLPKVSLSQEAKITVDAYPDEEFIGQVTKISPVLDLATRTAPIEITIGNPQHRLQPGMFARVNLSIRELKNIPVILKEAVMGKEPDLYVFVVEENKAVLRKVKLGIRQGPYIEAKEGLKAADLVVIMGQQRLYDNAAVIVEQDNGIRK